MRTLSEGGKQGLSRPLATGFVARSRGHLPFSVACTLHPQLRGEGQGREGQEWDMLADYQWLSFPVQHPPGKVPRKLLLNKYRAFLKKHPTYFGFHLTAAG